MALPAGPKSDKSFASIPRELDALDFVEWWGGKPYDWQLPLIEEYCADERPSIAYVQVPRKNGKSFLGAVIAIDEMVRRGGKVFLIADSERNLKSALFSELVEQVTKSPQLTACVHVYKDHLECAATGGGIFLRPNNVSASQSINPDLVLFDEVHMQRTSSIWNNMGLAGDAMPRPLLLGITTPGYETVSLANDLYASVKAGGLSGRIYDTNNAVPIDEFHAGHPSERALAALREANPILVNRPELLQRFLFDPQKISEYDYRRFRLGQWTVGATAWLPTGVWAARTQPQEYALGERLWVGFDGSYSGDSTALVACNSAGHVKVLGSWENPHPTKRGWRVPRDEVQTAVQAVMGSYDATLYPDPPYWQSEIAEWSRQWPGRVIDWPTNSPARMAPACSEFEARVLQGDLTHDGHRQLEAHLSHCTPKHTPSGVVIVKPSPDSPLKIDLAVAAVIAVSEALIAAPVEDVWVL